MANPFRPSAPRRPASLHDPSDPAVPDAVDVLVSSISLDAGDQAAAAPKKPHPPNRKQHELDLKDIADKIAAKEREIAARRQQYNTDTVNAQRKTLNEQIQEANRQLAFASDAVKKANDDIQKKHDEINRLRPRMTYRSETQIDQTINRLEHQRTTAHFSLPEEQKIIREIDKLRRSKNELRAYNNLETDKRKLDGSLKELRDARQARYMGVQRLVSEDRGLKEAERQHKESVDILMKDIHYLTLRRKQVVHDFEYTVSAWEAHVAQGRRLKYLQDQQARSNARSDGTMVVPVVKDPYAGAKQVVSSLLTYLQQYVKPEESISGDSSLPSSPSASVPSEPSSASPSPSLEHGGAIPGFFLPRKLSTVGVTVQAPVRFKKEKKKKIKSIAHSAAVVQQFVSLDLIPPANVNAVQSTIDELRAKKLELERKTVAKFASLTPKVSPEDENQAHSLGDSVAPPEASVPSTSVVVSFGDTVDSAVLSDIAENPEARDNRGSDDSTVVGSSAEGDQLLTDMQYLSLSESQVLLTHSSTVGSIISEEDASNISISEWTAENSTDEDSHSDITSGPAKRFSRDTMLDLSLVQAVQQGMVDGFEKEGRVDGPEEQHTTEFCPIQEPETPEIDESFSKPRFPSVEKSTGDDTN
ncbi:hypothetical protein RvY_14595 [Ramazzottius varieornatus]|uniref:Uncharacterized protein n=1 Tax=Ramazzottius varieornatus TaxID=947166 RepID=A0A1D1VRU6_RAMVA|nr:hypothetical protein RvY_14595 [Ramazzottius varieornatus]